MQNDKIQLAAMGAELRLTEEQAKGLAERMPQTGTLQILDDEPLCTEIRINGVEACGADIGGLLDRCLPLTTEQKPLCMATRIEELEAQARVMAGLLREAQECVAHDVVRGMGRDVESLWARIDAALAGKMPSANSVAGVDWSSFPGWLIDHHEGDTITEEMLQLALADMLSAAPSPCSTK